MAHITDRMYEKRWGVFNHFLFDGTKEEESCWNEFVEGFDVELVARNLHEMGAGYYFITTMQGRKFMIAPNQTFDRIAGTKTGEACATRIWWRTSTRPCPGTESICTCILRGRAL